MQLLIKNKKERDFEFILCKSGKSYILFLLSILFLWLNIEAWEKIEFKNSKDLKLGARHTEEQ